ncbi:hypothetical protein [Sphingopyxis sp.]|jgi:hypothetical protein|uniref:hypothetical protein n=1 Tax=Sphingopyxis sp. TaxID=1908224 RepID=UPI0025FBD556|nr:hypothetical protein [Sphingopyxis sp.]MBK6413894.1 hypothetical protein [Sphingopyxis sp.]
MQGKQSGARKESGENFKTFCARPQACDCDRHQGRKQRAAAASGCSIIEELDAPDMIIIDVDVAPATVTEAGIRAVFAGLLADGARSGRSASNKGRELPDSRSTGCRGPGGL